MHTIKILTYSPHKSYNQPHFFIQAKGYNAGRPSAKPYSNSYIILVNDETEKGMLFWVCFGLWKTNRFVPLLNSSYTLNQQAAGNLIDETCKILSNRPGEFLSNVREMKELIQTEALLNTQIKLIKQLKKSTARKMVR